MSDLPVLLDDPVVRPRRRSASADAAAATSATPATPAAEASLLRQTESRIPWPWWMAPARVAGRIRPALGAAAAADALAFRRLPRLAIWLVPPILVFAVSAVVSISHAERTVIPQVAHVDWLRFATDVVYTESAPFLLFAVIAGALSPALGALLVAVFGVMDIAAATQSPYELHPLPGALVGRLVAIWLLWLLAVEIPVFGRQLGLSWQRLSGNRFAVAILTAVATGAFVWFWTQAALVLIRPVFIWSTLPSGVTLAAVFPTQSAGLAFAVAGGLVAGLGALVRGPAGLLHEADRPSPPPRAGLVALAGRTLRRVVVAALLVVGLGGLISWPLEAVVLFIVLLGAAPLARFVADRTPLGSLVLALPPIARYALATALSFGVAQVTIAPLFRFAAVDTSGRYPEFFSVVAAIAIGIVLVQLATTPATRRASAATVASTVTVALALTGGLFLVVFLAPLTVAADNCAGLSDCWGVAFFAALTGGALPLLYGMAFAPQKPPPPTRIPRGASGHEPEMPPGFDPPRPPRPPDYPPPPPPPDRSPEDQQRDDDFNRKKKEYWDGEKERQKRDPEFPNDRDLQRKKDRYIEKQREFWTNPPRTLGDGHEIDGHALASSGASTRG